MRQAHMFVITSVKDLTSTVLVEALALGLPIICPDHCGFPDAIDETSGLKLPTSTPREFIAALSLLIQRLYYDEARRSQLAAGAFVRSQIFSWEEKVHRLNEIYQRKAGSHARGVIIGRMTGLAAKHAFQDDPQ